MASIQKVKGSAGSGNANVATVQSTRAALATTIVVDTVLGINPAGFAGSMGTPHTFTDPVTSETITVISDATAVDFTGHVNSSNLEIDTIAPGYTDLGSKVGDIVIIKPTTQYADNLAAVLGASHNDDGSVHATRPQVITSIDDTNGNELIKVTATASAINELTLANAAAGGSPTLSSTGGDTNIDITFSPKGTGKLRGIVDKLFNPYKFSVYRTAATTSSGTPTLVPHDTKLFDTGTNVDVVTNKGRFTAPIAGFYFFTAQAGNTAAASTQIQSYLYKNGAVAKNGQGVDATLNGGQTGGVVTGFMQLAANDYVEHFFVGGGGSTMNVGANTCYFEGFLVSAL